MGNLMDTIILVLPGLIAVYFLLSVGPTASRMYTDYERTILGLIFNAPGLIVAWGALSISRHAHLTISQFETIVLHMPCIILYFIFALITSIYTALWWNFQGRSFSDSLINKSRDGKRPHISSETAWEVFVGPEQTDMFIRIYPIGQLDQCIVGRFLVSWAPGDNDKGIVLDSTERLTPFFEYFKEPIRTYVDTVTKTVYEIFPPTEIEEVHRRVSKDESN